MLFDEYRERILAWLEADLKKVDREKTPWLIVSSHFPIYSTYDGGNPLLGEGEGEEETDADNGAKGYKHLRTTGYTSKVQPSQDLLRLDLEPLLKKYNVDVYFTGHNHNYETTWPMFNATSVQKDFKEVSERTSGNGYSHPHLLLPKLTHPIHFVWLASLGAAQSNGPHHIRCRGTGWL